ncbi:MAG: D-glycero-beta-D-manno-heptose 1-phosphate adenylyltransferase [Bacteroidales bacterium]|nr:D-glycero-beta-D-manno-heptose 1-phosphate adenylyltransferase [Bacteroidales bacterium]
MSKLEIIKSKIFSKESLKYQLAIWRFLSKKIVFTNGCFDILHLGHIDYLSKAAEFGNVLIVGLNSDDSVRTIKGINRPINDENSRAMILAFLSFVSAVILFDEDTPYNLIKFVQPDVLIKGSDYKPEDIVGYDIVKAKGGEIKTIDFLPGYSTTSIIDKIKKS